MKNFEYAKNKNNKKLFKIPRIKTKNYDIVIFALPIAPFVIVYDKIHNWNYERQEWSDEKAKKVLDYWLPHVLEYDKDDNCYYYCMEWYYSGWDIAKRVPIYLKLWTRKFGHEILGYLKNSYENEAFEKMIEEDYYETWIKFKFKKKG